MKRERGQKLLYKQTKKRSKKNNDTDAQNSNANIQSSSTEVQMADNDAQESNTAIQAKIITLLKNSIIMKLYLIFYESIVSIMLLKQPQLLLDY